MFPCTLDHLSFDIKLNCTVRPIQAEEEQDNSRYFILNIQRLKTCVNDNESTGTQLYRLCAGLNIIALEPTE